MEKSETSKNFRRDKSVIGWWRLGRLGEKKSMSSGYPRRLIWLSLVGSTRYMRKLGN